LLHKGKYIVLAGTEVHDEIEVVFFGFMNLLILCCKLLFSSEKSEYNRRFVACECEGVGISGESNLGCGCAVNKAK
jgi:hypothetical protein